jgi:hypothetical protein
MAVLVGWLGGLRMTEVFDNTLLQAGINKSIPISILNFNSLWNGTSLKID